MHFCVFMTFSAYIYGVVFATSQERVGEGSGSQAESMLVDV